jgi:hypothetical protein
MFGGEVDEKVNICHIPYLDVSTGYYTRAEGAAYLR